MRFSCKFLWLISAFSLTLPIPLNSHADTLLAQAATSGSTRNTAFFQKAKRELPGHYYFLYRIIDRLARANNLDQTPWRIISIPEYDINAFAAEANLIAIYTGLIDSLAGDADAVACVIGHEMAHHEKRHNPLKMVDQALAQQRVENKKQELARQEQARQNAAQGWSIIQSIVRGTTGVDIPINPVGIPDSSRAQADLNQAAAKENENLAVASQQMEFEADRAGYEYVARAGFDPQGCLRVMTILGRMPAAEFNGTHPAIPRRVEQLNALMRDTPAQTIANEGRSRLQGKAALTYAVSEDRRSLRVNSRFGSAKGGFVMSDL